MTKREYLESIDFDNLSFKERIHHSIKMIDGGFPTLEGGDDKHIDRENKEWKNGYSEEFREANEYILNNYPDVRKIMSELKIINKLKENRPKNHEEEINLIYHNLAQPRRDENLTKILS